MASARRRSGHGGTTRAATVSASSPSVSGGRGAATVRPGSDTQAPDLGARVALGVLAGVLLLAPLVVDTGAEASFDAPKRLVVLVGSALAAAAGLVLAPRAAVPGAAAIWRAAGGRARAIALLAAVALAGGVAAAVASPRAALSTSALRVVLPLALLLPLGASRVLERGGGATLLAAFVAASCVDAFAALLERTGTLQLFAVESVAGRGGTGAFVGNEGSFALLLALGTVASLAFLLETGATAWRVAAALAVALQGLALALDPSLTALLALLAGTTAVSLATLGRRAVWVLAACVGLLAVTTLAYAPLGERVATAARAARAADWDALLTYRLGPWAAASEMVRARPLLGFGPGTFGAEFTAARLRAEERHLRRFVLPRETSTFAEAHSEYLQVLAEAGVPAGTAALAALALLVATLARAVRRRPCDATRAESVVALGLVVTGVVGAATWFPLQLASTAPVLLLALGRAWRLVAAPDGATADARGAPSSMPPTPSPPAAGEGDSAPALRTARALAAGVLVVLVVVPEVRRHGAERELARATAAVKVALAAPRGTVSPRALDAALAGALASAATLPGDPRPVLAAGAIELVAGRPEQALERYRAALGLGERAETDLNAGRAYALLDRRPEALAAFVRTAWLSPALVPSMPAAAQPLAEAEVARLAEQLRAGSLTAPPPLPESLRVPGVR